MRSPLGRDEIEAFLATLAHLQLDGCGTDMVKLIRLPVAYYLPDRVLVFTKPEKLAERFEAHRAYLTVCRVIRIEARALRILDATPDRALVQLEWHYLSGSGATLRRSRVQYVLARTAAETSLFIELVDYSTVAFPQFMQHPFTGGRA
jgi:hypothetical protein